MNLKPIRGTHDLLPEECARHRMIIDTAQRIAAVYGYDEMATPLLEFSDVFKRTLGDASDIVNKEMYTFEDRGGEQLTLRPEGTRHRAGFYFRRIDAAILLKVFYHGAMFRYERPQKGRQRQFHQIGAELLGVAGSWADVECIAVANAVLLKLEVIDKTRLDRCGGSAIRAATPQGWLRAWGVDGRVTPIPWAGAEAILLHLGAGVQRGGRGERGVVGVVRYDGGGIVGLVGGAGVLPRRDDGPRGARLWAEGGAPTHVPAYRVPDVDPTGAGDVFAAAFLIALWRGEAALDAVRYAHAAASFVVAAPGASGMPTERQIRARMGGG